MHQYRGKMIIHTGSMFSGKTSSLWKDLNRFSIAGYDTVVFKPVLDERYGRNQITTHDNNTMEAISIEKVEDIVSYLEHHETDIIGIDEIQFLQSKALEVCDVLEDLLKKDYTIVVAGLDMDFEAKPFEIMKELMPKADYLNKHHAVCSDCGTDAWVSFRFSNEKDRIQIGASESYRPLCRRCYMMQQDIKKSQKDQIVIDEMMK
ncbi:MAG: thymidine kinase [Tissierellia bacterium]|nr:thymidine kinase [Tissierellia bacterium]